MWNLSRLGRSAALIAIILGCAYSAEARDTQPKHVRVLWLANPAKQATIAWTTEDRSSNHHVHFDSNPHGTNTSAYPHRVEAYDSGSYKGSGDRYHHARLTGLQPNTTYYLVLRSGDETSEMFHFTTAPNDNTPFSFLVGGDSRSDHNMRRNMNRGMRDFLEDDPKVLALLHGGDYVEDGSEWNQWDQWLRDHQETTTRNGRLLPIIPTRGNHEESRTLYNQVFASPGQGHGYYSLSLGPVGLVILNTEESMAGHQRNFLNLALRELKERQPLLMASYHRAAWPAVKDPSGALQHFVPLFDQYGVQLVFESDGHALKRTIPIRNGRPDPNQGVIYVGEGGLGVPQRSPNHANAWYLESPGYATSEHHVHKVTVRGDRAEIEVLRRNGQIFDRFEVYARTASNTTPPTARTQTVIPFGARWSYYARARAPANDWHHADFNDQEWYSGPGQLGYGDGDETTRLPQGSPSYYFRHAFTIEDLETIDDVSFTVIHDDGVALWLNGQPVFQRLIGGLGHRDYASGTARDNQASGGRLNKAMLRQGRNVLAAVVKQHSPESSDVSFDLRLNVHLDQ